jgi:hypothetical protein
MTQECDQSVSTGTYKNCQDLLPTRALLLLFSHSLTAFTRLTPPPSRPTSSVNTCNHITPAMSKLGSHAETGLQRRLTSLARSRQVDLSRSWPEGKDPPT